MKCVLTNYEHHSRKCSCLYHVTISENAHTSCTICLTNYISYRLVEEDKDARLQNDVSYKKYASAVHPYLANASAGTFASAAAAAAVSPYHLGLGTTTATAWPTARPAWADLGMLASAGFPVVSSTPSVGGGNYSSLASLIPTSPEKQAAVAAAKSAVAAQRDAGSAQAAHAQAAAAAASLAAATGQVRDRGTFSFYFVCQGGYNLASCVCALFLDHPPFMCQFSLKVYNF